MCSLDKISREYVSFHMTGIFGFTGLFDLGHFVTSMT